jgi:hypothetical protein
MAKEKKVNSRKSTYASSSEDESSDDDEIDYASLFKGLDRTKIDKINELIDALNDKNRLLEKQEDLLYDEHDKFVEAQKSLALEIKSEFEKLKFARDAYTIGRHPSIKDGLGFKREVNNLTSHKASISAKEKGKAPMANSVQKNHAFLYHDRKFTRNVHHDRSCNAYGSNAMLASSSSYMHGRNLARRNTINHMSRRNVVHIPRKTNSEPSTIYHALNASFAICRKDRKIVARKLGAKCKGDKTCIWVPKAICTNLVGPNISWVPKTQA